MKQLYFISILLCLISFPSCKPTEKGYKSAYDAALNKREAAKNDILESSIDKTLQQDDGPQIRDIDGIQVYIMNRRLVPADFVMEMPDAYNVAIGQYKMITNCKSQAENLLSNGYHAFPAKDTEGMFFTIAGSFPTLSEAVKFYQDYKKGKNRTYVGLPDSPVIIYSPK